MWYHAHSTVRYRANFASLKSSPARALYSILYNAHWRSSRKSPLVNNLDRQLRNGWCLGRRYKAFRRRAPSGTFTFLGQLPWRFAWFLLTQEFSWEKCPRAKCSPARIADVRTSTLSRWSGFFMSKFERKHISQLWQLLPGSLLCSEVSTWEGQSFLVKRRRSSSSCGVIHSGTSTRQWRPGQRRWP